MAWIWLESFHNEVLLVWVGMSVRVYEWVCRGMSMIMSRYECMIMYIDGHTCEGFGYGCMRLGMSGYG